MWAWVAPGSGLSVNIGRAFIVERGRKGEGLHKFLTKVNRDLPQGRERLARVLRDIRNVSDDDPMEFDSIVFPARSHKSWHGEAFDEVVMLRWGREMAFVGSYLEHFRCGGPHPDDLRPCQPTDTAVRLHGPSCALPRSPAQLALTGCPYAEQPDTGLAVSEARKLQREFRSKGWNTSWLDAVHVLR